MAAAKCVHASNYNVYIHLYLIAMATGMLMVGYTCKF